MRNATTEEKSQFTKLVQAFNQRNEEVKLALAPFVAIQPWLLHELQGASIIIIRMFLISHFDRGNDIVTGLNLLARQGAKIEVYVDWGQYEDACDARKDYYVQTAVVN